MIAAVLAISVSGIAAATAHAQAPVNVIPPEISGSAVEGETLMRESDGTWTGDPDSFDYQWQSSADGIDFVDIDGAVQSSYTLTAGDVGKTIRLEVIASNADGPSEPAFSNEIGPVTAAPPEPPVNTDEPTISGQAVEGETLTSTDGSWDGDPDSFDYQWQSSDGGPFEPIDGAVQSSYTLTSAEVGETVRLRVIASNEDGPSLPAFSNEIGPVAAAPVPPQRSLELSVKRRLNAYKRATIRVEGVATPPLKLWVLENLRGKACPATPTERKPGTRALIDGVTVGGDFSEERRPRMKRPGRHAYCAYLGPDEDSAHETTFITRKVRKPFLSASRARETVKDALQRHGFANRVLANLSQSCARRSRSEFECQFSSSFPGYSLSGHGSIERKRRVSYRFPVSIKGRSFTLTDENEGRL